MLAKQVGKVANGRQREVTTAEHHSHTTFPLPMSTASHTATLPQQLAPTLMKNFAQGQLHVGIGRLLTKEVGDSSGCHTGDWDGGAAHRDRRAHRSVDKLKSYSHCEEPSSLLNFCHHWAYIPNPNVPLSNLFCPHLCVYRPCFCSSS